MSIHTPVPVAATVTHHRTDYTTGVTTLTLTVNNADLLHLDLDQDVTLYQPHAQGAAPSNDPVTPCRHPAPFSDRFVGAWCVIDGLPGYHIVVGEDSQGLTLCLTPPRGIGHYGPERVVMEGSTAIDFTPPH